MRKLETRVAWKNGRISGERKEVTPRVRINVPLHFVLLFSFFSCFFFFSSSLFDSFSECRSCPYVFVSLFLYLVNLVTIYVYIRAWSTPMINSTTKARTHVRTTNARTYLTGSYRGRCQRATKQMRYQTTPHYFLRGVTNRKEWGNRLVGQSSAHCLVLAEARDFESP